MAGFLFSELVFGPVKSRRLGVSLGINVLPTEYKYCSFNCIYCECGWTFKDKFKHVKLPKAGEIKDALEKKSLQMLEEGQRPDAITFAGNGEPTLHPDFPVIVDDTIELRDKYFPEASVTVLSNASMLHKEDVLEALKRVDQNMLKLDAGTRETFQLINQPPPHITLEKIIGYLKKFDGHLIIQSLFLRADINGKIVDNTLGTEVDAWIGHLKAIRPYHVVIYPVDRETPEQNIEKISFDELTRIGKKVEDAGFRVKIFG
jgi:wyosine [tRNA(Phe)-imidazoG37] synthetase (radical SAM superfamily)